MLARLQQCTTALWLAAWLAGLGWAWQQGRPDWAWAWTAVACCGHAVWLALCMALAHWRNAGDPAPRASAAELLRAWWGEVLTAPQVFCWRQPFASRSVPDGLGPAVRGRPGVLLLHGFICNRGLWNPWLRWLQAEGIPCVAINLEPVFGRIDEHVPLIEAALQRLEAATGERPLVVAHSMGGLSLRAWLRASGGDARLRGAITIGSPHAGTWLAHGSFSPNGRQMCPGNPWLDALAASETEARRALFTCVWSACDNIVFPASTALLPGARSVPLRGSAHVDLLDRPELRALVREALVQP